MAVLPPSALPTVELRTDSTGIHLVLPPATLPWAEVWNLIQFQLRIRRPFWHRTYPVSLRADDWDLDGLRLQAIATQLASLNLSLHKVFTRRRSTAVAAAGLGFSVDQSLPIHADVPPNDSMPLYVQTTVRSGTEIRHASSVIVLGDVNPGAEILAEGDILVWGRLRGVAHAGSQGSPQAVIMALQLEPTQLRIANQVARSPEAHPYPIPEVAFLQDNVICIATLSDFLRRRP